MGVYLLLIRPFGGYTDLGLWHLYDLGVLATLDAAKNSWL